MAVVGRCGSLPVLRTHSHLTTHTCFSRYSCTVRSFCLGTPEGVGKVVPGQKITCGIHGQDADIEVLIGQQVQTTFKNV